jgi:hypothetical protein
MTFSNKAAKSNYRGREVSLIAVDIDNQSPLAIK